MSLYRASPKVPNESKEVRLEDIPEISNAQEVNKSHSIMADDLPSPSPSNNSEKKEEKQKMIITGDDILIEYVSRIIQILDNILKVCKEKCIERAPIDRVDEIIPQ